jgi:hypothetical protein
MYLPSNGSFTNERLTAVPARSLGLPRARPFSSANAPAICSAVAVAAASTSACVV